jgi:hypothetical protein
MIVEGMQLDDNPRLYTSPGGLSKIEVTDKWYNRETGKWKDMGSSSAHVEPTFLVNGKASSLDEVVLAESRGENVEIVTVKRLNSRYFGNIQEYKEYVAENISTYTDEDTGIRTTWHIKDTTPVTTMRHEGGHVAHVVQCAEYMKENGIPASEFWNVQKMMINRQIDDTAAEMGITDGLELKKYLQTTVSGYAAVNNFETVAESFRAELIYGSRADPFCLKAFERFNKPFKGKLF